MHRFALMWLVYSRNKFFKVGPEKFVLGEPILEGSKLNVTAALVMNNIWHNVIPHNKQFSEV